MFVTINVFILDQDKHEGQIGNVFLSVCFSFSPFPRKFFRSGEEDVLTQMAETLEVNLH